MCFERKKKKENFTLFGRLNDSRQKVFKYFRMDISKFEKFKELLPTDSQEKNTVET